ncbi:MAG TPA: hypothetical protein VFF16_02980 [Telluria sp.]|nr:hypothetical protein [Telluria sp.]
MGKDTQKSPSQQSGSASTGGMQSSSAAGSTGSMGSTTGGAGTSSSLGGATGGMASTAGTTGVQRPGNGAAGMHTMDENIERGKQNLHRSIDQAADAAQPLVDRLASTAHAGVDRMSSALSGVGQTVSEKSHQLRDAYGEYLDSGRDYIRMKPATAVAGAFVAGFLLAKIFSSSRRD